MVPIRVLICSEGRPTKRFECHYPYHASRRMFLNCSLTFALTVIDLVNINVINICLLFLGRSNGISYGAKSQLFVFVCVKGECMFIFCFALSSMALFRERYKSIAGILNV